MAKKARHCEYGNLFVDVVPFFYHFRLTFNEKSGQEYFVDFFFRLADQI
jgi:hypothetical protein